MNKLDSILVLGGSGMVGSALVRNLKSADYKNILSPSRQEIDLLDQKSVDSYFKEKKPQAVFMAAAKVGGIHANNTFRADFILQNLQIQNNTFSAALASGVDKFLFLGSSCIYPRSCPQPIKEEYLLTEELEPTNEPYAIAKIAGLKTAESIRRQYKKNYFSVMPTNLYGENDNYHPENSHVIPGLIQRMEKTLKDGHEEFEIWGDGAPLREFLYVDDLADACIRLMSLPTDELPFWINVGSSEEISIADLARLIGKIMGFKGAVVFNKKFPNGTPRKLMDSSKMRSFGWTPKLSLEEGLKKTIKLYREKVQNKEP
jgi:GDP-L-fucose synthase